MSAGGTINLGALVGLRAQVADGLKGYVRKLAIEVIENQIYHAEALAAGQFNFRAAFVKDIGPAFGNSRAQAGALADTLFRFFEVQWRTKYPRMSPRFFLDHVEIKSPPTAEEIENAWTVEIGSNEAGLEANYEGGARTRTGPMHTHGARNKLKVVH